MIRWDGQWTSCGRAKAAEIAWEEARGGWSEIEGMMQWDGRWTKAVEIAWEEARDGGARLKGMIRWTSRGRAGAAEI